MLRKLVIVFIGAGVTGGATLSLLTLPLLRRLPKQSYVTRNGITTLDVVVKACQRTHLHGWALVEYAQSLVARKWTYSRLNTWDTPARAFERGMGYCEQQTLALKYIYDRLGIESRPVFALHCKFPAQVVDGMIWPGGVSGHPWLRPFTHLGSSIENIRRDMMARRNFKEYTRRPIDITPC